MTETPSPTIYRVKDDMDVWWYTEDRAKADAIGAESGCPVEPLYDREALDAARRDALEEAAECVATDENQRLDEYYCCSAMDGPTQVCSCQGVSIREELNLAIRALMDKEPSR